MSRRHHRQPIGRGDPRSDRRRCRSMTSVRHNHQPQDIVQHHNEPQDILQHHHEPQDDVDYIILNQHIPQRNNDRNNDHNHHHYNNDEIPWHELIEEIHQIRDPDDLLQKAYDGLLDADKFPSGKNLCQRWKPLGALVHWFLMLGWFNGKLNFTRSQMKWILNLLITLQYYKYLDRRIFIPTDPTTISKWRRYFPTPQLGIVLLY